MQCGGPGSESETEHDWTERAPDSSPPTVPCAVAPPSNPISALLQLNHSGSFRAISQPWTGAVPVPVRPLLISALRPCPFVCQRKIEQKQKQAVAAATLLIRLSRKCHSREKEMEMKNSKKRN